MRYLVIGGLVVLLLVAAFVLWVVCAIKACTLDDEPGSED